MTTDQDPDNIDPTELDIENHDEWTEAEREAYNEYVEQDLTDRIEEKQEAEAEALDLLREDAQESLDTETVTLEGAQEDFELEVRTRIPPEVEDLMDQFEDLREDQDIGQARITGCRMIAAMVESPSEFTMPNVWIAASKDGSAGIQWLQEKARTVMKPARKRAGRERVGNSGR